MSGPAVELWGRQDVRWSLATRPCDLPISYESREERSVTDGTARITQRFSYEPV